MVHDKISCCEPLWSCCNRIGYIMHSHECAPAQCLPFMHYVCVYVPCIPSSLSTAPFTNMITRALQTWQCTRCGPIRRTCLRLPASPSSPLHMAPESLRMRRALFKLGPSDDGYRGLEDRRRHLAGILRSRQPLDGCARPSRLRTPGVCIPRHTRITAPSTIITDYTLYL